MTQAVLIQASESSAIGYQAYGAARELWRYKGPEAILSGPYETGKTMLCLNKLNALMAKYGGARGLMIRKTYKSLITSAVVTFEQKVFPYPPSHPKCMVSKYGGEKPEWYDYPNGSRLTLGGMDNPDKFLSAEYDFIYINQAEELTLDDYEKLSGRATGRAGNTPYPQVFGDCNPGPPTHWILHRPRLKLFESRHRDNPTLYDPITGEITEQGQRTMETLDALTGVRYKRGRLGLWVAAEGQVYEEYDPAIHLIDWFEPPSEWRRIRVIDFGYTNPFVCGWWAIDHDGRMYLYREIYMSHRLVEDHARQIKELSAGERIEATITDHDAEDRATLERHGIPTEPAQKSIRDGIQAVQERLKVQRDGKPRLMIMRDALVERDDELANLRKPVNTEQEFAGYVYPKGADGKPNKEVPIDLDNHGMDMKRYAVRYVDETSGDNRVFIK